MKKNINGAHTHTRVVPQVTGIIARRAVRRRRTYARRPIGVRCAV